jgi:hypothetical protein
MEKQHESRRKIPVRTVCFTRRKERDGCRPSLPSDGIPKESRQAGKDAVTAFWTSLGETFTDAFKNN